MKTTHTPGPWATNGRTILSEDGRSICNNGNSSTGNEYDNAAFIVRACNAHDDLVEALEDMLLETNSYSLPDSVNDRAAIYAGKLLSIASIARAAIAKAKGE